PLVVGGVVDEDRDWSELGPHTPDGRLEGVDVGHVAPDETRLLPFSRQPLGECDGGAVVDVEESDARSLAGKSLGHGAADAGAAAGDQDHPVLETWVVREGQAEIPAQISRSVSGSKRQALLMSTPSSRHSPSLGAVSGSNRATSSRSPTRATTIVSAPVGSTTSTAAFIR